MYIQLPGYDDFRGFDVSNENDLTAISKLFYEGFSKPSRLTHKRHIFRMNMPKKLRNAIRETHLGDKKDELTQELLFSGMYLKCLFQKPRMG